MESLQKKLAAARAGTDYEALEVVQKTIDTLQRKFQDEVCLLMLTLHLLAFPIV